jgi:hypothetical protein
VKPPAVFPFGALLAEVRKEQGFATPFAFFRSRGGQRGLGLTFANYLRLEKGRGLPKGWRLKKLLEALELLPHSEKAKKLVRGYLVSVLGSEELLADVIAVAGDPAPGSWKLAESAAQEAIGRTKVQLDLKQYAALAKNPVAYACHVVLCNSEGWFPVNDLAKAVDEPKAKVAQALKDLAAAELVKLSPQGARSTLEKNYVAPPAPTPAMAAVYAKLKTYRENWLAEHARAIHTPYLILRAPRAKMQRFFDHLTEVVSMSSIYGSIERGPDSGMFLVEGRVYSLFNKE